MGEEVQKRPRKLRFILICSALVALLSVGVAVGIFAGSHGPRPVAQVPASIAEQVLFPVYTTELPKGYTVVQNSFHVQERALTFTITSTTGAAIAISQQAKPAEFNFDAFYQQQMDHARNLQGAPYSSVLGSVEGKTSLLSVITDKTWLLINTKTATDADMRFIAQHIQRAAN